MQTHKREIIDMLETILCGDIEGFSASKEDRKIVKQLKRSAMNSLKLLSEDMDLITE